MEQKLAELYYLYVIITVAICSVYSMVPPPNNDAPFNNILGFLKPPAPFGNASSVMQMHTNWMDNLKSGFSGKRPEIKKEMKDKIKNGVKSNRRKINRDSYEYDDPDGYSKQNRKGFGKSRGENGGIAYEYYDEYEDGINTNRAGFENKRRVINTGGNIGNRKLRRNGAGLEEETNRRNEPRNGINPQDSRFGYVGDDGSNFGGNSFNNQGYVNDGYRADTKNGKVGYQKGYGGSGSNGMQGGERFAYDEENDFRKSTGYSGPRQGNTGRDVNSGRNQGNRNNQEYSEHQFSQENGYRRDDNINDDKYVSRVDPYDTQVERKRYDGYTKDQTVEGRRRIDKNSYNSDNSYEQNGATIESKGRGIQGNKNVEQPTRISNVAGNKQSNGIRERSGGQGNMEYVPVKDDRKTKNGLQENISKGNNYKRTSGKPGDGEMQTVKGQREVEGISQKNNKDRINNPSSRDGSQHVGNKQYDETNRDFQKGGIRKNDGSSQITESQATSKPMKESKQSGGNFKRTIKDSNGGYIDDSHIQTKEPSGGNIKRKIKDSNGGFIGNSQPQTNKQSGGNTKKRIKVSNGGYAGDSQIAEDRQGRGGPTSYVATESDDFETAGGRSGTKIYKNVKRGPQMGGSGQDFTSYSYEETSNGQSGTVNRRSGKNANNGGRIYTTSYSENSQIDENDQGYQQKTTGEASKGGSFPEKIFNGNMKTAFTFPTSFKPPN